MFWNTFSYTETLPNHYRYIVLEKSFDLKTVNQGGVTVIKCLFFFNHSVTKVTFLIKPTNPSCGTMEVLQTSTVKKKL